MTGRTDAQAAELADYLIDRYGAIAAWQAGELAKEAHRSEDFVAEAFWWSVSTRIRDVQSDDTLAA